MADPIDNSITVTAPPAGVMSSSLFTQPDSITAFTSQGPINPLQGLSADGSLSLATPSGLGTGSNIFSGLNGFNFNAAGSAISDLTGAIGDASEASAYEQAAKTALQNEKLAGESGALQGYAAERAAYQTIGRQKAQVAGNGFTAGGSNEQLLRSSQQQASLNQAAIHVQTSINENGYAEQATAYQGQAKAAQAAEAGGIFGGILQGAAAIIGL